MRMGKGTIGRVWLFKYSKNEKTTTHHRSGVLVLKTRIPRGREKYFDKENARELCKNKAKIRLFLC
jgi:hypothetical protein